MIVGILFSCRAFLVKMIESGMSESDEEMGVTSSTCLDSVWALAELDS